MSTILETAKQTLLRIIDREYIIFLLIFTFVLILRSKSFYQSALDIDEGLYLLMANAWLDGFPPYTVIFDNKPPGIYALFALALSLLGKSLISIRLISCLFVSITSFVLYQIGKLFTHQGKLIGLLAALLFATAVMSTDGVAANTELFFTAFTSISCLLVFRTTLAELSRLTQLGFIFSAGVLLGVGFEIKQVVIFDLFSLGFILILAAFSKPYQPGRKLFIDPACLGLGFIIPFLLVSLYFHQSNAFHDYVYANFTANRLRIATPTAHRGILFALQTDFSYLVAVPAALLIATFDKTISPADRQLLFWLNICFFGPLSLIFIVFGGFLYAHYFLQLVPVLCLLTAYVLLKILAWSMESNSGLVRKYVLGIFVILPLLATKEALQGVKDSAGYIWGSTFNKTSDPNDVSAEISHHIKRGISKGEYIYAVDCPPIFYFLTDAEIPTRYPFFPMLLPKPSMPNIIGINPLDELARIKAKDPIYVIRRTNPEQESYLYNSKYYDEVSGWLNSRYFLERRIGEVDIYRRQRS